MYIYKYKLYFIYIPHVLRYFLNCTGHRGTYSRSLYACARESIPTKSRAGFARPVRVRVFVTRPLAEFSCVIHINTPPAPPPPPPPTTTASPACHRCRHRHRRRCRFCELLVLAATSAVDMPHRRRRCFCYCCFHCNCRRSVDADAAAAGSAGRPHGTAKGTAAMMAFGG